MNPHIPSQPKKTPHSSELGDIDPGRVAELLAKQEILEVIYRRARAADRRDVRLARSCYHEGATENHGGFIGPVDDFLAQSPISWSEDSPLKRMWHFVSNTVIDVDIEAEGAFAESYVLCEMDGDTGAGDSTMLVGGRYLDTFAWRGSRWGILARTLVFDWSRVDPATAPYWEVTGKAIDRLPFGRPGADDPLYGFIPRSATG